MLNDIRASNQQCRKPKNAGNPFNAGKTQLVLFDQSNYSGATSVKTDGSVLVEKCFRMLGLSFSSKLN